MTYPAAGEWTAASDSNAPPGGDSSSAWDQGPRSPVPADSLAPGRDAAGHPPRHGWPFFASDSGAPPGGDSSFPVDHFKPEYFDKLAGYFVEAARRLPLAEIPYLAYCFTNRSLAIGLADPVTNIILTAIDAFAHTEPYRMMYPADIEQTRNKISFAAAARSSWVALQRFMLCYFRYLDDPQADILLHNAGFDLRVAIEAVQLHLDGAYNHSETLVPDSARTKAAFEYAAYPRCSAPHLLRLMTSSYPCCMVEPVLEDLRRGKSSQPHASTSSVSCCAIHGRRRRSQVPHLLLRALFGTPAVASPISSASEMVLSPRLTSQRTVSPQPPSLHLLLLMPLISQNTQPIC
jgi:hypothetical protein